jgi:hypothetical protein
METDQGSNKLGNKPAKKASKKPSSKKPSSKKPYKPNTLPIIPFDPQTIVFIRTPSPFNILPDRYFHPILQNTLDFLPLGLKERNQYIEKQFPLYSPFAGMPHSPFPCIIPKEPYTALWSKEKSLAIRRSVCKIMRFRFVFRKFLHKWRFSRIKLANTEDLVTSEPPQKPVYIVDWPRRQAYVFEAQTLMKDITARLQHNDGLFEDPQPPRNPFTNTPFTLVQTISVWNSISEAGIAVSSLFTLYRTARYSHLKFIEENLLYLRLSAHRKTFKEETSYDYKEQMLDFIHLCYTAETLEYNAAAFSYILFNEPKNHVIQKWKRLCEKYYEADIIYWNNPKKANDVKETVLDDTYDILSSQNYITSLYNRIIE